MGEKEALINKYCDKNLGTDKEANYINKSKKMVTN